MVYNRNLSVLSTDLWAPNFSFTTTGSTFRAVEKGTCIIREMLLNFMLSEEVRPYCGVDINQVRIEEGQQKERIGGWEIWERKIMGIMYSPYNACHEVT